MNRNSGQGLFLWICLDDFRFSLLLIPFLCLNLLFAQPTNEAIFSQKAIAAADSLIQGQSIAQLEGVLTPEIQSRYAIDSSLKSPVLAFYLEEIRFKSLGKGKFARYLQGSVNLMDTTERALEFQYSDTLSRKAVSQVRKTKLEQLRGNNPVLLNKVGIPFITVAASVGMVIALFYVRTQ